MPGEWIVSMKPSFQTEWLGLPPKEAKQILEKLNILSRDPAPDAKVKKQLKHLDGKLHRLRSGDYRIFYTFEEPYISLLALRRRDSDTYEGDVDADFLGGLVPELTVTEKSEPDWETIFAKKEPEKQALPEPITEELLKRLRIPDECHKRLLPIGFREDLLDVPGIPDEYLLKLDDYLFEKPLVEVLDQPDFVAGDLDDLIRFKEGELLHFLLRLDSEQEKFVTRGLTGTGPTLLKGSAGSGKSTVALYRTKAIVDSFPPDRKPKILFTTYTNALVRSSEELLEQLLGEKREQVMVRTADSIAVRMLKKRGRDFEIATENQIDSALGEAIRLARFQGNELKRTSQQKAVARLGQSYLKDELLGVIGARGVDSLENYLEANRPGRKVGLNKTQREAVWRVWEEFNDILSEQGKYTWQRIRKEAGLLAENLKDEEKLDAVIVDEAQDLDPTLLNLLVNLCKDDSKLFITADANQSIYGSGFNWSDVHDSLQFKGRTGILRTNHRSTREIGLATARYLEQGGLEPIEEEIRYVHSWALPAVRNVKTPADESLLLSRYLPGAAKECRLTIGACAVLVPTIRSGEQIADRLVERGVDAEFMEGTNLDLRKKVVKVITLKSAKGLEFPIVALAGFVDSNYPFFPRELKEEALKEYLQRERRTLYVAMTRAMRALLVVCGDSEAQGLLKGFDSDYWNTGL